MQFTVELPDNLAGQVIPAGCDPARIALEGMAVEAYRTGRLSEHQLATLLRIDRYELDGFLKRREVWLDYATDELQLKWKLAGGFGRCARNRIFRKIKAGGFPCARRDQLTLSCRR